MRCAVHQHCICAASAVPLRLNQLRDAQAAEEAAARCERAEEAAVALRVQLHEVTRARQTELRAREAEAQRISTPSSRENSISRPSSGEAKLLQRVVAAEAVVKEVAALRSESVAVRAALAEAQRAMRHTPCTVQCVLRGLPTVHCALWVALGRL